MDEILADGSVLSANWQGGSCPSGVVRAWAGWFPVNSDMDAVGDGSPLPPGTLFTASGAAPVDGHVAPPLPGVPNPHMDVFVAGNDGQVMSAVWENRPKRPTTQKNANGKNVTVSMSTNLFPPTGGKSGSPSVRARSASRGASRSPRSGGPALRTLIFSRWGKTVG
jgi:hypothetical protein